MEHRSYFDDFLKNTVNIGQDRLDSLETSIGAIQSHIRRSNYGARVRFFQSQGSLAHGTIINPVNGKAFDADIVLVVSENLDWEPKKYLLDLRRVFWEDGRYSDRASLSDVCVTLKYANDKEIDILPLLNVEEEDGQYHICHHRHNEFIRSEPLEFSSWLVQKNRLSGGNSFRKVTRLLKYLRDHKRTFTCPSVLFTTLVGERITDNDKGSVDFQNVPVALKTVLNRLDSYLILHSAAPRVNNPSLKGEDLGALWTDTQFKNFKSKISDYAEWVNDAYEEQDHNESLRKWRKVFGEKFAEGKDEARRAATSAVAQAALPAPYLSPDAAHSDSLVDRVLAVGLKLLQPIFYNPPHLVRPTWSASGEDAMCEVSATFHNHRGGGLTKPVADGEALPPNGYLRLSANTFGLHLPKSSYHVQWRVTNTGLVAKMKGHMRGDFYMQEGHFTRWESLSYRGVHFVEAFVIRTSDNRISAKSAPFHVVIE